MISTGIDWAGRVNQEVDHEPQVLGQPLFESINSKAVAHPLGLDRYWLFGNPAFRRWGISCTNN